MTQRLPTETSTGAAETNVSSGNRIGGWRSRLRSGATRTVIETESSPMSAEWVQSRPGPSRHTIPSSANRSSAVRQAYRGRVPIKMIEDTSHQKSGAPKQPCEIWLSFNVQLINKRSRYGWKKNSKCAKVERLQRYGSHGGKFSTNKTCIQLKKVSKNAKKAKLFIIHR